MGLKGILSLLQGMGKGGRKVFSPATQARNMQISPATQARNMTGAGGMAKAAVAKDAMAKSRQVVDGLITKGQIPPERREEVMRKIMAEVAKNLQNATAPVDPNALAKKVLAVTLGALGIGGATGYGIGRNQEAIQEMLEAVQLPTDVAPVEEAPEQTFREKFESGQWGPDVANTLMDIISPIPRQ